jgi:DNA-directed RNA polymerase subunit RPC12/RpoP
MKVLKNQTVYKCEYCSKKNFTKRGSELHETKYCKNENSPHQKAIVKKQEECLHENTELIWSYIPGEAVKEPDYDQCIDCGKRL